MLLSTVDLGVGSDAISCLHDSASGRILLIDRRQQRLLAAPWSVGQPVPTNFVAVLDATQAPFLAEPSWELDRLDGIGIVAVREQMTNYYQLIEGSGGNWSAVEKFSGLPAGVQLAVENADVASASWPVRMKGPIGAFEIRDLETSSVVATGSIGTSDVWFDFTPPSGALTPGHRHEIAMPQFGMSEVILPLIRFGSPMVQGSLHMHRGRIGWGKAHVNSPGFAIASHLSVQGVATPFAHTHQVVLWVALTGSGDPVPIVSAGTASVILPTATVGPFAVTLSDQEPVGPVATILPIPNSSDLEGVHMYFQFGTIASNGQPAVTDVFSTMIGGGSQGSTTAIGSTESTHERSARQRSAIQGWLPPVSPSEWQRYRRIVRSLRDG